MKKFLASIFVIAFALSGYAKDGFIFVRTLRGDAEISVKDAKLKTNEVLTASGAEISVKDGGFASFALSNYTAAFVLDGKVKIEKFEQDEVQLVKLPLHSEMASSKLEISIDEGEVVFARGEFRPASSFKIKTKFGVIEPVGENVKVKAEKSKLTVWAYDAALRFTKLNSTEQEYIPIGYELICELKDGAISSDKKRSSIVQKAALKEITKAVADAFKTTEFFKDSSGKISARRINYRDFFIRTIEPIR